MAPSPRAAILHFQDIQKALPLVRQVAHHTPLVASHQLSALAGCEVLLKAECLQRTGSFKLRGAVNKLASLAAEERAGGIIAASAGNHAQGVAFAAREAGVSCTIVMPVWASLAKVQATRNYGATVVLQGDSLQEAITHARALGDQSGAAFIHPYDDPAIVAGQGTLGVEICHDAPGAGLVLVPVGGGGLLAGVALAVKTLLPRTRVIGVQAAQAPALERSFHRRRRLSVPAARTLADGIAVSDPGRAPWRLIRRYVDDVVTVSEEAIAHAQVLLLERAKLLVEGAGAVGVAALMERSAPVAPEEQAVVVLSGGNVDIHLLSRVLEHGLAKAGRFHVLQVELPDTPGQLARLLSLLAGAGMNILNVEQNRYAPRLAFGCVLVEITGETRDSDHAGEVMERLRQAGYTPVGPQVTATDAMTWPSG